ncbi:MAG TPA: asparagine synthase (glutamine-hydrolyzing) [Pusillimonas sp.]|uniref:asparagine synthase (glutamine-hydrolyzing) n=1 Tax=Pusillimonas sp. TaxID=3040095 RepID=UPI002CC3E436|nr:asparagine synthase (glutamine-hydrolyzing) [Pusillimonas sp.]HUH88194.1 asparagine synthase (glutamine-hydrolyzing) [Pusillimonas sp.]
MCGILGAWGPMPNKQAAIAEGCKRMQHRGPDSSGYWQDTPAQLALGHVRLAIVDLSEAGHQPMPSHCGRYVLVLNGEIYNHLELRASLEQQGCVAAWRGHSDTETLVEAFCAWGVEATLQKMTGMFALALWDRQQRTLSLARDRFGEKPLYLGYAGGTFVFGSELKAMAGLPGFDHDIDRQALTLLMRHNYIPAPLSIYRAVRKLTPGTWLQLDEAALGGRSVPSARAYWSAEKIALNAMDQPLLFDTDQQAVNAFENVVGSAVQGQMMADVPLGAFLSGGIDSSTIVALMQARSANPVSTFSIGFDVPAFNEAEHARAVAQHLGTQHHELYLSAQDALNMVPALSCTYDEPFADSSQIPTALVARMAKRDVTVALSGDGGDELMGGYSRYFRAAQWWARRESMPTLLRGPIAKGSGMLARVLPEGRWSEQADKLSQALSTEHSGLFYRQFVSYWKQPEQVVIGGSEPSGAFHRNLTLPFFDHMTLLDTITYMPDDILVKVDRAAMAVSLETRVPLLDHEVYEFVRRLPQRYKYRNGQSKWLLRQLLYKHVPRALVDRPKKGFGVPLAVWLRGPLKDWGHALLEPSRLKQQGLFQVQPIQQKWQEHQSGRRDWSAHLWGVLMAQAWLDDTASQRQAP